MASGGITLDSENFFAKLKKLQNEWQKDSNRQDAFLAVMGKSKEDTERPETSDFILWLLNWEFSDTIIILMKTKVIFAVSPKKAQLLTAMKPPTGYEGPELEVITRNIKQEEVGPFVTRVMESLPANIKKVAIFEQDKVDGELTDTVFKSLNQRGTELVDMKPFMTKTQQLKVACEHFNMREAAKFNEWTFGRIISEIEEIIDEEKTVKHSFIQEKVEATLSNDTAMSQFSDSNPSIDANFLEYNLPVMIQSGGKFNIHKFQVDSSDDKLDSQVVYINLCTKYCDMSAMASRTLIINPDDTQEKAYKMVYNAQETLISELRPGKKICDAYLATKNYIQEQNQSIKIPSNFGFGIGFTFSDSSLIINESNQTVIREGMTFHARVALSGIHKNPKRSIVAIGDTVLVKENSQMVLTNDISKKYANISYSLDDEGSAEPQHAQKSKPQPSKKAKADSSDDYDEELKSSDNDDEGSAEIRNAGLSGNLTTSRTRSKANTQQEKQGEIEERKDNQKLLMKKKQTELKIKVDKGQIKFQSKKKKVKNMSALEAYKSQKQFPKDLQPGKICVDTKNFSILIPNSPTTFIPLHVGCIKSVSDSVQGQWTILRINFHIQGSTNMEFPADKDPSLLFMKQLTMKTRQQGSNNRLSEAAKKIKECLKQLKLQDEMKAITGAHDEPLEHLIVNKNMRREVLENLVIRPNIVGKKTVGVLEIHQNGVRFQTAAGQKVDICFSNIKHCFYQPCASDELIVLLHFHLHQQIKLGEKMSKDVQFFKESGTAAEDINFKGRSKMNEMDELQQEEMERHQRKRLNQRFHQFAQLIEKASERNKTALMVDIPEDDLAFTGCPQRQNVKIRPTQNCLVALSEFPFFVLDVDDIEVVHFERMIYGIKNFDLVIIFKDFQTYHRIDSVPIEYTDQLKSYFNEIGIIYLESQQPFKWDAILSSIREDFENWVSYGPWKDFVENSDDEGDEEEDSENEDSVFKEDEEEGFESESSDYSEASVEESSDVGDQELSEEGQSWDELEKAAAEEDRKQGLTVSSRVQPTKGKPNGARRR